MFESSEWKKTIRDLIDGTYSLLMVNDRPHKIDGNYVNVEISGDRMVVKRRLSRNISKTQEEIMSLDKFVQDISNRSYMASIIEGRPIYYQPYIAELSAKLPREEMQKLYGINSVSYVPELKAINICTNDYRFAQQMMVSTNRNIHLQVLGEKEVRTLSLTNYPELTVLSDALYEYNLACNISIMSALYKDNIIRTEKDQKIRQLKDYTPFMCEVKGIRNLFLNDMKAWMDLNEGLGPIRALYEQVLRGRDEDADESITYYALIGDIYDLVGFPINRRLDYEFLYYYIAGGITLNTGVGNIYPRSGVTMWGSSTNHRDMLPKELYPTVFDMYSKNNLPFGYREVDPLEVLLRSRIGFLGYKESVIQRIMTYLSKRTLESVLQGR